MNDAKFKSTALILETIWFAKEEIDYETKTIDWITIIDKKNQISPSSTELLKLDIAQQLWQGEGLLLNFFIPMNMYNRSAIFEALKIRLSES